MWPLPAFHPSLRPAAAPGCSCPGPARPASAGRDASFSAAVTGPAAGDGSPGSGASAAAASPPLDAASPSAPAWKHKECSTDQNHGGEHMQMHKISLEGNGVPQAETEAEGF